MASKYYKAIAIISALLEASRLTVKADSGVEDFVTRMYIVVLNREPDTVGVMDWSARLRSGTSNATDIVHGFFRLQRMGETSRHRDDQCNRAGIYAGDPIPEPSNVNPSDRGSDEDAPNLNAIGFDNPPLQCYDFSYQVSRK